jgi:hypothetical protein
MRQDLINFHLEIDQKIMRKNKRSQCISGALSRDTSRSGDYDVCISRLISSSTRGCYRNNSISGSKYYSYSCSGSTGWYQSWSGSFSWT